MKHVVFAKSSGPRPAFEQWLLESFGRGPLRGLDAVAVNVVTEPDAPWDVAIELWDHDGPDSCAEILAGLTDRSSRVARYRVTELVGKDEGPTRGWPTVGVKTVVPWVGRTGVSIEERRRHWDEHVPLANRIHVGVTRYVRNWVESPVPGASAVQPPYQGIASQHFFTLRDLQERMFDSPSSVQRIADDVAEFIAEHAFLVTTEYFRSVGRR